MRSICLGLLFLCACGDPNGGIAVGNPTNGMTLRLLPSDDISSLEGTLAIREAMALSCQNAPWSLAAGITASISGTSELHLPRGEFCGVQLELDGPVEVMGTGEDGGFFTMELDVGRIEVRTTQPFEGAEFHLLFLLGGEDWLSAETLGLEGGTELHVDADHPRHDEYANQIASASMLCEDFDADGRRDGDEAVLAQGRSARPQL